MQPFRLAVATQCFGQPLKESLQTAADIGAQGVRFDARGELRPADLSETGRREFLHRLDELGLAVAALTFPTRRAFYAQDQLEARLSGVRGAMQFASQLKCRVVTVRVGRVPDDDTIESDILRQVLNDLARYGNRVGVALAITPGRESPETLRRLVETVTEGPLGIDFDPATCVLSGQNPGKSLRELHALVMHVQIRDAVQDVGGLGREVPVGRGEVDWDELLALIDEAGYRGWLTVDRTEGDDKLGDAARAIQYLRQVAQG